MKNTVLSLVFLITLAGISCTKEELVIIDEPTEVNENSPIFQGYLAERAISFIKLYRFDKLNEILDKIIEPTVKSEVMAVYNDYKHRADKEALYFVNSTNDTLYFLVASDEPDPATRLEVRINSENTNIPKTKGQLSGLDKFPKLEKFSMLNALVDEVTHLQSATELTSFTWDKNPNFYQLTFPGETFVANSLLANFSKNDKLKNISLSGVNIDKLVFPTSTLDQFELRENSLYNTNDGLNNLRADKVILGGKSERNNFVLTNNQIKTLQLNTFVGESFGITQMDISETNLESLRLRYGGQYIEELKLNTGLKTLETGAQNWKKKPELPNSLTELNLLNYILNDLDFSTNTSLKQLTLGISGLKHSYDNATLRLPPNLTRLSYTAFGSRNQLNLSSYLQLRSVELTETNDVIFPPNVEEINLQYIKGVLDLSSLAKLKRIKIFTDPSMGLLNEIIFPPNLTEADIHDYTNNFYTSISVKRSCKLTNMPTWMQQYIYYQD